MRRDADAAAVSIVYDGNTQVGLVTSGGYGYRLKQSIALAYLRADLAVPGKVLEIEILGERRRAVVGKEPLYDPEQRPPACLIRVRGQPRAAIAPRTG